MTEWTDLVTKVYNENKGKAGYRFKNALKDAAKIYKKSKKRSVIKAKPSRKRRGTRKA